MAHRSDVPFASAICAVIHPTPISSVGSHRRSASDGDVAWDAGEKALMRGLVTACPCIRPGLVLSYNGRRQCRPQSDAGNSPFNATSPPIGAMIILVATEDQVPACCPSARAMAHMKAASSRAIAVTATVLRSPRAIRCPVALGQARLCVPRYVSHDFRQVAAFEVFCFPQFGRIAVSPGAFSQDAAHSGIPSLGDAAPSHGVPGRALRGDKSEISHQLSRVVKVAYIADFDHEGSRTNELDPTQSLQAFDYRREWPVEQAVFDCLFQACCSSRHCVSARINSCRTAC